jgi:hypothetical protein
LYTAAPWPPDTLTRHEAHLTLPTDWKQAGQHPLTRRMKGLLEAFSYIHREGNFKPGARTLFVSIPLRCVTKFFQVGIFCKPSAN